MPILNTRIDGEAEDSDGNKISLPKSAGLQHAGPRVAITLFPLEEHVKELAAKGLTPSAPVTGFALIDTGASSTCFDRGAAERAGLAVVDSGPMTSATHENEIVPIYAGRLTIQGISQNVNAFRAFGANLRPQGLVALIGRDLLASCVLIYNGPDGSFSLSI